MALIARIFIVLFAFLVATVVAAAVLTFGLLPAEWNELTLTQGGQTELALAIGFSAALIGGYALFPVMLLVAIAEGFRLRSILFYATAGAAAALLIGYGARGAIRVSPGFFGHEQEVVAASGIVAGLMYWAVAGRKAGAWRDRRGRSVGVIS